MPTNTYVAIDSTTLTSAVPSVTFSNLGSYTDLVLVMNSRSASTTRGISLRFNNDTNSNYSITRLRGNGSTASSNRATSQTYLEVGDQNISTDTAGNRGNTIVQIQNYSNGTTHKTILSRSNVGDDTVRAIIGLWRSTNAITEIDIISSGGDNFASGSTFSLYGIKSWSDEVSPKATGGYVYEDSSYWYHSFPFSSTFTPSESITADVLLVAGGGGGGQDSGGGGGAGGLLYSASQSMSSGVGYTITVGGGGNGSVSYSGATSGSNSTVTGSGFTTLTAIGGGRGATSAGTGANAQSGGSGGGGSGGGSTSAGTGTAGQGNNGGTGVASAPNYPAGGGGGAGGVGGTASLPDANGDGGVGLSTYSSWGFATQTGENINGTYYYAGGGGGTNGSSVDPGLGGYGGGGRGDNGAGGGVSGLVATGGGGGGGTSGTIRVGGNGGSGVVIVRYAK